MRFFKGSVSDRKLRIVLIMLAVLFALIVFSLLRESAQTITHEQANRLYTQDKIDRLLIDGETVYIITKNAKTFKIHKEAIHIPTFFSRYKVEEKKTPVAALLIGAALLAALLFWWFYGRDTSLRLTKSLQEKMLPHKREFENDATIRPIKTEVRFSDVAGIEEVKEELEEIIDFLVSPQKYTRLGIRLPKGILLEGPPGVGKTHIAKAVANEANVPFFYHSGSAFTQLYVGAGPKRVRELFAAAKASAPSIVFIDEIDAVGKQRGKEGSEEREATLNQLLTEMDGFESDSGVIVIAATNKIEVLDEALLRPGRFDRRIFLSLPDAKDRLNIIKLYLKDKKHHLDLDTLAANTVGFSAAGLETLVNEAAIHALRSQRDTITQEDVEAVKDKVLFGKRKAKLLTPKEKDIQALYQSAKAVVATWLDLPFEKVGFSTLRIKSDEEAIVSRSQLLAHISFYLSGKVAMRIDLNESYTNVAADIEEAKKIASAMVEKYAMDKAISPLLEEVESNLDKLLRQLMPVITEVKQKLLRTEYLTQSEIAAIIKEFYP